MNMNMHPVILSLMRHGESCENVVFNGKPEHGGEHPLFSNVVETPTWQRPLSEKGIAQAKIAREWFTKWRQSHNDPRELRGYASYYFRARETAGYLDLGLRWKLDVRPCERNWGMQTYLSDAELETHFPFAKKYRDRDALLWAPVGGDTMQLVVLYLHDFLATLARDCSEHEVVVVTHGETMYGFQYILDHWLPEDLAEAMGGRGRIPDITNCMVIQYTRIGVDGIIRPHYVRKRFVNPLDMRDRSTNTAWFSVEPERTFSAHELLAQVAHLERYV